MENWDFREGPKKVNVPTLVIHGGEESIPMDMIEEWTTILPHSELKKIAKACHFSYVEQPKEVWPLLESFIESLKDK